VVNLQIWELTESLSNFGMTIQADCFVAVFDVNNRLSYEKVKELVNGFKEDKKYFLVGNKIDRDENDREVNTSEVIEWIKDYNNAIYTELSAKNLV